jgi:DNA-binding protein Fis
MPMLMLECRHTHIPEGAFDQLSDALVLYSPDFTMTGVKIPAEGLSLEDNERVLLARALERTAGNQTQAARLLRVFRHTLRHKMKKFNLR